MSCRQVHLNFYLSCCQITLSIQGNIALHCIFFTCPPDIGWKYMLVLIEILLFPGSRTSDFFTPERVDNTNINILLNTLYTNILYYEHLRNKHWKLQLKLSPGEQLMALRLSVNMLVCCVLRLIDSEVIKRRHPHLLSLAKDVKLVFYTVSTGTQARRMAVNMYSFDKK